MRWLALVLPLGFAPLVLTAPPAPVQPAAADPAPAPAADPNRYGPAYRYTQDGWVVLHIEGEPYPRGYQHGRLLAKEIAAYVRMLATECSPKAPADGWKAARLVTNAAFLRKIDPELLEEMKGIADGATDAGASYEGRDIDLLDVAVLNVQMELASLESALHTMPTGLEGKTFPRPGRPRAPAPRPKKVDHCSAFIATGPATADGKIVFGHITMAGLTAGPFVNYWIDVAPHKGRRFVMQAFPGGVWSSQDYYINDAGVLLCETTIDQTPFDAGGVPLASRTRKAIQYAEGIDAVVKALSEKNNGLYANEWLVGDLKTNEIAMFELGTKAQKLWRSSKDQWFGGTKGFYWGCNNAKDRAVRREALPADEADRPAGSEWEPDDRDKEWLALYKAHAGKIDAAFAKKAFTNEVLAQDTALDAKYTTAALAAKLSTHALYGPPTGKVWKPTPEQLRDHPEIVALEPHPWTVLTADAPAKK
ncbi:phospholipase B family protein [Gemmata sp. JC673]|uniref:Phospholipase B family protein n=1 Tax=Gemmata algarum TaxID=2975278 RepID=A0ABU5ES88_9BACT|nr:C45 family autoproteolytic acyltransferase/hydolase [Gemmata algarum]MDY3558217.1 phospholipase B family protein [Gemmata algarum]